MTAHEQPDNSQPQRRFGMKQERQEEVRPEQTDEEILNWMSQEIQADKAMLDLLAEL